MREYLMQRSAHIGANFDYKDRSYIDICDYVLDRGTVQPASSALTEEQYEYLMRCVAFRPMPPKQCFHNSQMLLTNDQEGRLQYKEGFAYTGALPVHHAWVELDGKLVDVTRSLRKEAVQEFLDGVEPQNDLRDRVLGEIPTDWIYLGCSFDTDLLINRIVERGATCCILDNWQDRYPELYEDRLNPISPELEAMMETMRGFVGRVSQR